MGCEQGFGGRERSGGRGDWLPEFRETEAKIEFDLTQKNP